MKTLIIGSILGGFDNYRRLLASHASTVQLGDLGINSTSNFTEVAAAHSSGGDHLFIRGSKTIDNPDLCEEAKGFCPDAYFLEDRSMFFFGGTGDSFKSESAESYIDYYAHCRPSVVLTYEPPADILGEMYPAGVEPNSTGELLQFMLERHQPDLWLFGRYQQEWSQRHRSTQFVSLVANQGALV